MFGRLHIGAQIIAQSTMQGPSILLHKHHMHLAIGSATAFMPKK
jgi:hypothetical protein